MSNANPLFRQEYIRKNISIRHAQLAEFCRRNHIRKLSLFGSVLRDDFCPDSDVDMLVEFEPGCVPGFGFIRIERELTTLLNRDVDLNTPRSISKYFRDEVLDEAEAVYVKA
ncbi:MAG: nucleotidyltransferase family protein [Chloroflexota bacterium]